MRRLLAIAVAVGATVPLAGCGSSDKGNGSSGGSGSAAVKTLPATTPSGSVVVTMKNIQFVPSHVTVKVGQKITWTNDDQVAHTVTAIKGAKFDSGIVNGGGNYHFTPTKAGTISYVCTIHPNQTGTITVEQ
jgi:plastocyanin